MPKFLAQGFQAGGAHCGRHPVPISHTGNETSGVVSRNRLAGAIATPNVGTDYVTITPKILKESHVKFSGDGNNPWSGGRKMIPTTVPDITGSQRK